MFLAQQQNMERGRRIDVAACGRRGGVEIDVKVTTSAVDVEPPPARVVGVTTAEHLTVVTAAPAARPGPVPPS